LDGISQWYGRGEFWPRGLIPLTYYVDLIFGPHFGKKGWAKIRLYHFSGKKGLWEFIGKKWPFQFLAWIKEGFQKGNFLQLEKKEA